MGSESQEKFVTYSRRQQQLFYLGVFVSVLFLFTFGGGDGSGPFPNPHEISASELEPYSNCSNTVPTVKGPTNFTTKPIWVSMAPFVISDNFHKTLINSLTGTSQGGKSFYASVKNKLRHCDGMGQTVTCLNVHPGVEMNKGFPDKISDKFYSKYIMVIRNPMTSIPATYNAKSEKYSGTVGQLSQNSWREARDKWFEGMLGVWKNTILTWNETKNYEVGMYLVYEELRDLYKGPILMKELRQFLLEAGFSVASEDELNCIWYNAVGEANLKQFRKLKFDYEDYFPMYTIEQRKLMLKEVKDLKAQLSDDKRLGEILDTYIRDISFNMRIDRLPVNKSEEELRN
jgi:hypothetical protein